MKPGDVIVTFNRFRSWVYEVPVFGIITVGIGIESRVGNYARVRRFDTVNDFNEYFETPVVENEKTTVREGKWVLRISQLEMVLIITDWPLWCNTIQELLSEQTPQRPTVLSLFVSLFGIWTNPAFSRRYLKRRSRWGMNLKGLNFPYIKIE